MITISKDEFKQYFESRMYSLYAQPIGDATNEQLLNVLAGVLKDLIAKKWVDTKINKEKETLKVNYDRLQTIIDDLDKKLNEIDK